MLIAISRSARSGQLSIHFLCFSPTHVFVLIGLVTTVGFTFNRAKVNNGLPPLKAKLCLLKKSPVSLRAIVFTATLLGRVLLSGHPLPVYALVKRRNDLYEVTE